MHVEIPSIDNSPAHWSHKPKLNKYIEIFYACMIWKSLAHKKHKFVFMCA